MHSVYVRANAVFFFGIRAQYGCWQVGADRVGAGLGVLAALAGLNVASTWIQPAVAPFVNNLSVHELRRLHKFRQSDRAVLTLDMDVDTAPLWNWNVKQIFVLVSAEYKGNTIHRNDVVLFDQIIRRGDKQRINGRDMIKYPLLDESDDLRDVTVTLKLAYDVHPLFGPLQLFGTGRREIPFAVKEQGTLNYTFPTVYN